MFMCIGSGNTPFNSNLCSQKLQKKHFENFQNKCLDFISKSKYQLKMYYIHNEYKFVNNRITILEYEKTKTKQTRKNICLNTT